MHFELLQYANSAVKPVHHKYTIENNLNNNINDGIFCFTFSVQCSKIKNKQKLAHKKGQKDHFFCLFFVGVAF